MRRSNGLERERESGVETIEMEAQIRERAYAIWQQEGCPHGREWDHWVRAAGELTGSGEDQTIDSIGLAPAQPAAAGKAKGRVRSKRKA
jgi:hypothetical protein